jgi:hypothetical protein
LSLRHNIVNVDARASAQWLIGSKLPVADLISSPKRIQRPRSQVIENTFQYSDIVLAFGAFTHRRRIKESAGQPET